MDMPYNAAFFAGQSARSLISARVVLGALFERFRPESVLDVGCGVGPWLRAAQELGVKHILGIDGDYVDRSAMLIDPSAFLPLDLERQRLCDLNLLADGRRFDLVISVEVAEHLSYARAESFANDLTWLSDVVLFSAAVPFQGGEHHVNEQWPEFWALLFRARGFECLDLLRPLIWARPDVDWWYAQNLLLFVRRGSAAIEQLRSLPRPEVPPLSLVHPSNYLAQILKWFHTHRFAAAAEEEADFAALVTAYHAGATRVPKLRAISRAEATPGRPDVFPNTRIERCFPETLMLSQQERLATLEREHAEATARAATLEAQYAELETQHRKLQALLQEQQERLATLEREHAEATARAATLETQYADLQLQHEILTKAHASLSEAYQAQRAEIAMRRSTEAELAARHQSLQAEHHSLQGQYHGLQKEMRAVRRELEERLLEIREALVGIVTETEQRIGKAEQRIAEMERSRTMRLARLYYALYSRPLFGPPLRLARRAVGSTLRRLRAAGSR